MSKAHKIAEAVLAHCYGPGGFDQRMVDNVAEVIRQQAPAEQEPVGYANFRDGRFGSYLHPTAECAASFDKTAIAGRPGNSKQVALYTAPAQPDTGMVAVPRELLESAVTWLEVHSSSTGSAEWSVADDLRTILEKAND